MKYIYDGVYNPVFSLIFYLLTMVDGGVDYSSQASIGRSVLFLLDRLDVVRGFAR